MSKSFLRLSSIILSVTFVFLSQLPSQQRTSVSEYDGSDWVSSERTSPLSNTSFISGILLGTSTVINEFEGAFSLWEFYSDIQKIYPGYVEMMQFYKEKADKLFFKDISIGQVRDGTNAFYKDFSNMRIKIIDAVYIVRMQIKGDDPDLILAQIRYLKMQPLNSERQRILKKKAEDQTIEERFILGQYWDKNGRPRRLFRYGDY